MTGDPAEPGLAAGGSLAGPPGPDPADPLAHDPTDENWHWDGERWQYAGAAAAGEASVVEHLDATGQWVWDGTTWQPLP